RSRKLADGLEQEIRPGGRSRRLATPRWSEDNDHAPTVASSRFLGYEAFTMQSGDAVGCSGRSDAKLICQRTEAQTAGIGAQQREHLALSRGQAAPARLGPGLLFERDPDLDQSGCHPSVERLIGWQGIVGPHGETL